MNSDEGGEIKNESRALIRSNTDISINKLEELLEQLEDMDCLNEKGKRVRVQLWRDFIEK